MSFQLFHPIYLGILVLLGFVAVFLWYFRYRFVSFVRNEHTPDMDSQSVEGYTDRMFYYVGESVQFFLHSSGASNRLTIRRMSGPYNYDEVHSETFAECPQKISDNASEEGCKWKLTTEVTLDEKFTHGYYQALLSMEGTSAEFPIYFIVGERKQCHIAILAPVSTWTAYNPWGGKSLYQNKFEAKTVYNVSTERPNTAFQLNHDIDVEVNVFNWFRENYPDVGLLPDYALEENPELLGEAKVIVLVYHCEYVTKAMYDNLQKLTDGGKSLISLGANQLYWKTVWHDNFTRLECRKDLTNFEHSTQYGGMWKHHFRTAKKYLGVQFSGSGMHTSAPYKVLKPNHWLYEGADVQEGQLFGMRGINELPIAGAETDKASGHDKNVEVIAHSLNCDSEETGEVYDPSNPVWNGEGGADLAIKYLSPTNAVLSTAAISSGSGLGTDKVFTHIVANFMAKYGI